MYRGPLPGQSAVSSRSTCPDSQSENHTESSHEGEVKQGREQGGKADTVPAKLPTVILFSVPPVGPQMGRQLKVEGVFFHPHNSKQ